MIVFTHRLLLIGATLFATAALAQAPIQDRSATAPTIEGARVGVNAARNARENAERRQAAATLRQKQADTRLKEAQAEFDSAKRELGAAAKELEAARKTEAEANTALDQALKK